MEINVGDYVRDKNGRVGKVFDITNEPSVDVGIGIIPEVNAVRIDKDKINYLYQEEITKHSKDIIDFIEDNLQEGFEYYLAGNILKYICRYKHKNRVEDLKKASWYLDKLVKIKEEQKWVGKEIKKDTNDNKEKQ